jgi:hypothetical protein
MMERERFQGICELASEGKIKWVDNLKTHEAGRVISCTPEEFQVEFEGHREKWSPEECKERTYGYKMGYGKH